MTVLPGGCDFAETPALEASAAHLVWDREIDPSVLPVAAMTPSPDPQDNVDMSRFAHLTTILLAPDGREAVTISDGYRRIRLDVDQGTVREGPVCLRYLLAGLRTLDTKALALRRLDALVRLGRFSHILHPREARAPRWIMMLRALDGACAGARQQEIAEILFGPAHVGRHWRVGSDSSRLRVQRLIRAARAMTSEGYRALLARR